MFKASVVSPVLLCTLLSLPVSAFAVSQVTVSSPGCDGVFVVQGNLEGVAGLDLRLAYDQSTLSSPQVTMGPLVTVDSFMTMPNPSSNPIRMAAVSGTKTITGSGTIATVVFKKVGASAGQVSVAYIRAIGLQQNNLPIYPTVIPTTGCISSDSDSTGSGTDSGGASNSGSAGSNSGTTSDSSGTKSGSTSGTTSGSTSGTTSGGGTPATYVPYIAGGTLTLPSDDSSADTKQAVSHPAAQESVDRQQPAPQESAPSYQPGEGTAPAGKGVDEPAAAPAAAPKPVQSVLQRFRDFKGDKTIKNLTGLFDGDKASPFKQSPAIAIADGKQTVTVTIRQVPGDKAPNFAFNSARYVSLARSSDGGWQIEVRPNKGVSAASVTLLVNGSMQEIPLTVAPRAEVGLQKHGAPTEADFALFLKERGTDKAPKYDLNGDGKRDYLDDYIFTANYLVKMGEMEKGKAKQKQAAQHKK